MTLQSCRLGPLLVVVATIFTANPVLVRGYSSSVKSCVAFSTTSRSVASLRPRSSFFLGRAGTHSCLSAMSSMTDAANHAFKRAKWDESTTVPSTKVIGTHSGTFQADEAMGVWMLRQLPAYRGSKVVRSRDNQVLGPLDIVIDVGGTYDHATLRYDHHQRGYDERFEPKQQANKGISEPPVPRCTKLSAAGLVYRHYGKDVIRAFYPNLSSEHLELTYLKLYDSLMEALDAIDTGVEQLPPDATVSLVYRDNTGLARRVGRLNPRWNEADPDTGMRPDENERFEMASKICGDEFLGLMTQVVESDIPARSHVETALLSRHTVDASGEVLKLSSGGLPWKQHLYELEKKYGLGEENDDTMNTANYPLIKFVLYTDMGGMWRIQAVTVEGMAFENRLSLPEEWRGVRDEDLTKIAGIPGCTFCHAAGFIGGNQSFDGALEMAKIALQRK